MLSPKGVYIHHRGVIRYMSLGPTTQIAMIFGLFILIFWLVFTGLNLSFTRDIFDIRTKFVKATVDTYEHQIITLQSDHDILLEKYNTTQNWFENIATTMSQRHDVLEILTQKETNVSHPLQAMKKKFKQNITKRYATKSSIILMSNIAPIAITHLENQYGHPQKLSTFDIGFQNAVNTLNTKTQKNIKVLMNQQSEYLLKLENQVIQNIKKIELILSQTELFKHILHASSTSQDTLPALGGPFIPENITSYPEKISEFRYFQRITKNIQRLSKLKSSLTNLPLAHPLHNYRPTSYFGHRKDPFNSYNAFHSGLDFGAPSGTKVFATMAGQVTKAGRYGPYGYMVEINHGNGLSTRYAHLQKILVKKHQNINFYYNY